MPTAAVRNGEIYYEESGSGEPIILLPGLGHDHTYFAKTVPPLAKLGRVIALDPRGLGQSTESAEGYSVEQWAEDVVRLTDHLGAPRAHLVGSSLGACVVLQVALDYPVSVASLVLVAGFSELDRSLEINFRMRLKILERLGLGDVLADHIAMWTLGRAFIETDEGRSAVERLFSSVSRNSPQKYRAFIRAILRFGRLEPDQRGQPRLTERLGEIRVPTRVIVGGHDILTPVSVAEKMAARIPGAQLRVIPECGHITFTERPAETVALIDEFLRGVISR
jgi:pimeloyl-ACP methyl ester carboxylesterase